MDLDHIGSVIRKIRIEKNITQSQLAKCVSCTSGALSKFELKRMNLEPDKITILMNELGITHEDIPSILERIQEEEDIRMLVFLGVESSVKQNILTDKDYAEFNRELSLINHSTMENYLRGKRFFANKSYDNAAKHYQMVIDAEDDHHCSSANLKSAAYLDLAFISHYTNNFKKMFHYYDEGIEHFNPNGERRHLLYNLYYGKAFALHEAGEVTEGSKADLALLPAWERRSEIEDILTRIKVHQLKASILMNSGKTTEARRILLQAMVIANANKSADGAFYVLVDLAKLAIKKEQITLSEETYLCAIRFEKKLVNARATSAYMGISKLYLSQGDLKKAKKHITKALKCVNKKPHNVHKQIQVRTLYGEILEMDGNLFDASKHYKEAQSLANEYELNQYKAALYEHVFRCQN